MPRKRPTAKPSTNPDLFRPEPPVGKNLVVDSFCGRGRELQICLETLKENLDVDGKRSKTADKRPWIIHGESRCGKSHLARRVLTDLPVKETHIQIEVPAREQLSALKVMRNVFREFVGHFRRCINDQRRTEPFDRPNEIRLLDDMIDRTERLLTDSQTETESSELATESAVEVGGEVGGFLGKLTSKLQSKSGEKTGRNVVLRTPDAFRLAELCRAMAEALLTRKLVRHILLLVDDVDLLETYQTPTKNSQLQRSILAEALCELHSEPGVDVLLTSRSWYAYTQKDFEILIDLTRKPLKAEDLVQIHDRRLKLYGAGFSGFLTTEAVLAAAEEMAGLPGVFLNHLQTAYAEFRFEDEAPARDYTWFLGIFRKLFEELRAKCSPAAEALVAAIRKEQLEITVAESNPFYGTAFDNQFVFQSYYNEKCYFAAPIMRKILQEDATRLPIPPSTGSVP